MELTVRNLWIQAKDGFWASSREEHYMENFRQVNSPVPITKYVVNCDYESSSSAFKGGVPIWGAVSVQGLYHRDGPVFFDDLLKNTDYKVFTLTTLSAHLG